MKECQPDHIKLQDLVPVLSKELRKGNCGRLGIIGGCEDYTGAPYFVAMGALRMGVDLSHILCDLHAGAVLKTYSPDLIVHPYFRSEQTKNTASLDEIETKVNGVLQKLHALSIGSGLGNDAYMSQSVARAIRHAKKLGLPMVLDADSLAIVSSEPDLIHGYKQAVLTPNAVEFSRMCKSLGLDIGDSVEAVRAAARALGGVTIIKKGSKDIISDGNKVFVCEEESGLRRCGGQGDILSGAIATFMAWGQLYLQNVWDHHGLNTAEEIPMLAAFAGSMLTKAASNITYKACGRSTQTSDILKHLPKAFDAMFS